MTVRFRFSARALLAARALVAPGAILLLIAAVTTTSAQGKIEQPTIEIAAVRDPQLGSQVAIADALGYFKDAGLAVTVRWPQSAADVITLMAGGHHHPGTRRLFTPIVLGRPQPPAQ